MRALNSWNIPCVSSFQFDAVCNGQDEYNVTLPRTSEVSFHGTKIAATLYWLTSGAPPIYNSIADTHTHTSTLLLCQPLDVLCCVLGRSGYGYWVGSANRECDVEWMWKVCSTSYSASEITFNFSSFHFQCGENCLMSSKCCEIVRRSDKEIRPLKTTTRNGRK